jgi:hypothetical protein
MQSTGNGRPVWLTEDFELRFAEAFGREMTAEERIFFGLDVTSRTHEKTPESDESS